MFQINQYNIQITKKGIGIKRNNYDQINPIIINLLDEFEEYAFEELSKLNHKFLYDCDVVVHEDNSISLCINPGVRALIPTEVYAAIPEGYELMVRPRSGLALKNGVTVCNSPGCVDSGYRNSIGVILINHGKENFIVQQGDRIAQFVLNKVEKIEWVETDNLDNTERGKTGFGASGIK